MRAWSLIFMYFLQILQIIHPIEECSETLAFATEPVFASLANILAYQVKLLWHRPCQQIYLEMRVEIFKMNANITFEIGLVSFRICVYRNHVVQLRLVHQVQEHHILCTLQAQYNGQHMLKNIHSLTLNYVMDYCR